MITGDTIAACATAPGEGGIAIVRVSGPRAGEAMRHFFSGGRAQESHRMYFGHIIRAGEPEEAMCVFMRAPRSYTCEDVVEFQIHGGNAPVRRLLAALYAWGIRPAEPGEFTMRAFLNGRIDLTRAEAVMDVLRAGSSMALRAGLREMAGGAAHAVVSAQEKLTGMLAAIDAVLDYPEEVTEEDVADGLAQQIAALINELQRLCGPNLGRAAASGFSVVLAGRPNVGKSSLLNALLGSDRAIVTASAGTTRDVLTEETELGGFAVRLSDTAGQREASDEIERMGVERAKSAVERADLVLLVLDGSEPLTEEDRQLLLAADERTLTVVNKSDLPKAWDISMLADCVSVSAGTGSGMDELKKRMTERVRSRIEPDAVFLRERQIGLVRAACRQLEKAKETIESGAPDELAAVDLQGAYRTLGEITGTTADEEIIGRIFRDFCVGK